MPLSTVLGAQSLVQPAVCTTATRPASPYTGQAIYDTTTATQLIWNGTAWTGTGALKCIQATTTFTAVTSFTADSVFTSTYDSYLILLQGTIATTDSLYLRYRTGGVDNTASNYNSIYLYAATTAAAGQISAASYNYMPDWGTTVSGSQYVIQNPATAVPTSFYASGNRGTTHMYTTSGNNTASTAFDGFKIYSTTGYNMTGTYTIYGYSKTV